MGNQAAHVIDKGKKIALAPLISHHDHGAVQGIALPEIVWGLGFKFAPIDGGGGGHPEDPFAFEEPVESAFAQEQTRGQQSTLFQFGDQGGKGASGHFGPELHDHGSRFFVDDPAPALVISAGGAKGLDPSATFPVGPDPAEDRGAGQAGAV